MPMPVSITTTHSVVNAIRRLVRSARVLPVEGVTSEMLAAIRDAMPHAGPAQVPYARGPQPDETMQCDLDIAGGAISTYTSGVPHVSQGKLWLWTVDQDGRGIRTVDGGVGTVTYPATSPQPISHQASVSWTTPPPRTAYGPGEWSLVGRA